MPIRSGRGFTQALASNLRSMINEKGAEIFQTCYLLAIILDCLSEAEAHCWFIDKQWQVTTSSSPIKHFFHLAVHRSLLFLSKSGDEHFMLQLSLAKLHEYVLAQGKSPFTLCFHTPSITVQIRALYSSPLLWKLVLMNTGWYNPLKNNFFKLRTYFYYHLK